jgi:hypothetical protein
LEKNKSQQQTPSTPHAKKNINIRVNLRKSASPACPMESFFTFYSIGVKFRRTSEAYLTGAAKKAFLCLPC